jgi:hypothetical protein
MLDWWVIEAESQAVPNTLSEHNFQDALKMTEAMRMVHMCGSGLRQYQSRKLYDW